MSPEELPAFLGLIRDQAMTGASPAVNAMSETYFDYVTRVKLRQSGYRPPQTFMVTIPGRPPHYMTDNLIMSMRQTPSPGGGPNARSSVFPTAIYARVLEQGAVQEAHNRYMKWTNDRGTWKKTAVWIRPHPYMRPSTEDLVSNGALSLAATTAFSGHMSSVWGS